jgi:hypothetical protein
MQGPIALADQLLRIMKHLASLITVLTLLPIGTLAQSGPPPSYARPDTNASPETIHGRITAYDGAQSVQVNDDRGFVDNVRVRRSTIVQPNGTRLAPGMRVTIVGVNRGSELAAHEIDVLTDRPIPQPPPRAAGTTAAPPAGTELTGILGGALDSKSAYAGQPVMLTNVASRDGAVSGATLLGMVTDVTHPGQGRNAQIRIHFESLRFADGTTAPVDGVVASMQVNTKSNAAKEVGGALVGMLVGNAVAKTILGASGGGVVGAIGGYVIAKDSRADVTIPAQTAITVRLADPRRQES